MSTILEMAEIVRAGASKSANDAVVSRDIDGSEHGSQLGDSLETGPWALCSAIDSSGSDSGSIDRFLRGGHAVGGRDASAAE